MPTENTSTAELLKQLETNWPEAVTPAAQLIFRLFRLNKIIWESSERLTQRYNISHHELQLLIALRQTPHPYQLLPSDLRHVIFLTSGGLTKMLGRLQKQNLIKRTTNKKDQRCKPVQLTKNGKQIVEEILTALLVKDQAFLDKGLSTEKIFQLTELMKELLSGIENSPETY